MRNLRRALSLALASVMVLGLMIVGSSAMTADFGDADQIDEQYSEAIDVLSTIGLFDGMNDDENSFEPVGTLTRAQAAKLLTVMRLGADRAESLDKNTQIFQDVPKGNWAAGFIAYCSSVGILAGNGDGTFDPDGKLTGVQFGKMLLVALGYDADIEGYVNSGSAWEINVATDMIEAEIDVEDISFSDPITREQAAQMVYNTICAPMVKYVSNNNITSREYLTTTIAAENTISELELTSTDKNHNGGYTVEFGEKYFTDLTRRNNVRDDFGRPSHTWVWKNTEIDTYIEYDLMVNSYVESVTGKDLYDLLGSSIVNSDEYRFDEYIDGIQTEGNETVLDSAYFGREDIKRDNRGIIGDTGRGVLTQVFLDTARKRVTISVINTYLAFAADAYEKNKVEFDVYGVDQKIPSREYVKDATKGVNSRLTVNDEDFDIADIKKDDAYLVTIANRQIRTLDKAEKLGNVSLSSFSNERYVVSEGNQYNYADSIAYKKGVLDVYTTNNGTINLKDETYNLYLDQYSNLIGVDLVSKKNNYVFITGIDDDNSNLANRNYQASAIFLDGSMKLIEINKRDSDIKSSASPLVNSWFTYTVNDKDIYTVKEVNTPDGVVNNGPADLYQFASKHLGASNTYDINSKKITLPGRDVGDSIGSNIVYGKNETVYINADVSTISVGTDNVAIISDASAVTGIDNVNYSTLKEADAKAKADINGKVQPGKDADLGKISFGAYTLYDKDWWIIATVIVGDDQGTTTNLVYAYTGNTKTESYGGNGSNWTWTRDVIINGAKAEITEINDTGISELSKMQQYNWYEVKYKADGSVKSVTLAKDSLSLIAAHPYKYIATANDFENAIDDENLVLFELTKFNGYNGVKGDTAVLNQDKQAYLSGLTLYAIATQPAGIRVDENVITVFTQKADNNIETNIYNGSARLDKVLKDLRKDGSGKYNYEISAVIENGRATIIVIRDLTNDNYTAGQQQPVVTDATCIKADPNGSNIDLVYYRKNGADLSNTDIAVMSTLLTQAGYTNITYNSGSWAMDQKLDNGTTIRLTGMGIRLFRQYNVTVSVTNKNGNVSLANGSFQIKTGALTASLTATKSSTAAAPFSANINVTAQTPNSITVVPDSPISDTTFGSGDTATINLTFTIPAGNTAGDISVAIEVVAP